MVSDPKEAFTNCLRLRKMADSCLQQVWFQEYDEKDWWDGKDWYDDVVEEWYGDLVDEWYDVFVYSGRCSRCVENPFGNPKFGCRRTSFCGTPKQEELFAYHCNLVKKEKDVCEKDSQEDSNAILQENDNLLDVHDDWYDDYLPEEGTPNQILDNSEMRLKKLLNVEMDFQMEQDEGYEEESETESEYSPSSSSSSSSSLLTSSSFSSSSSSSRSTPLQILPSASQLSDQPLPIQFHFTFPRFIRPPRIPLIELAPSFAIPKLPSLPTLLLPSPSSSSPPRITQTLSSPPWMAMEEEALTPLSCTYNLPLSINGSSQANSSTLADRVDVSVQCSGFTSSQETIYEDIFQENLRPLKRKYEEVQQEGVETELRKGEEARGNCIDLHSLMFGEDFSVQNDGC